ncbi:MAG: shikimate dehydrogenase [Proteobacteria bacterium]|nr:shikimate dehydrogenase [Pseudomonadota bacterium]
MSTATRAACVIGYPARQSRSPKLHGYWIKRYGIDGDYRIEEIAPENFEAFVTNLAGHGYVGANVTMPHKDAAFRLSQPDEKARAIGAANTLWLDGDILRSTNTDGDGFVGSLDASAPGWDKRTDDAVVLGAGGASLSIVYALLGRGISSIHVVNRTRAKADAVRQSFGGGVKPANWDDVPALVANTGLLVNATSLGMLGKLALDIDLSPLKESAIVSDIVSVPLKTPLLAAAEARGLTTSNGLEMLLHQAVRGFELWFGIRPEVTREQYDLIAADIQSS